MGFVLNVSPFAVFRSLAVASVLAVLLVLSYGVLLRDVHRGAVAALFTGFFGLSVTREPILLAVMIPALLAIVAWENLPSHRPNWPKITAALATFTSVSLALVVVNAAFDGHLAVALNDLGQRGGLPAADYSPLVDPAKPDIYVIVLDQYGRVDTLENDFGVDEQPFVDRLTSRGFDIASDSHSNYPGTAWTFASMLNMNYLRDIPSIAGINSPDPASDGTYRQAINDNRAFSALRDQGYQIFATGSGWEQLAFRQADVYLDAGELNSFEIRMLGISGLGDLIQMIDPAWAGDQLRGRTASTLANLERVAEFASPRPRLVFAHVMAPHPPIVYGPDGQSLPINAADALAFDWDNADTNPQGRAAYAGEVGYLNKLIIPVIDDIIQFARRPTVVVLMSDHGSRMVSPLNGPETYRNFFATLTPGHPGMFGQSPTLVNLFPHLLNTYLGEDLSILPDLCCLSPRDDSTNLTPTGPDGP